MDFWALCGRFGHCNPETLIHTYNAQVHPSLCWVQSSIANSPHYRDAYFDEANFQLFVFLVKKSTNTPTISPSQSQPVSNCSGNNIFPEWLQYLRPTHLTNPLASKPSTASTKIEKKNSPTKPLTSHQCPNIKPPTPSSIPRYWSQFPYPSDRTHIPKQTQQLALLWEPTNRIVF